jgi:hypothetical protein
MYYTLDSGNDTFGLVMNGTHLTPYSAFESFAASNPDT